jgi:hypothetical protein
MKDLIEPNNFDRPRTHRPAMQCPEANMKEGRLIYECIFEEGNQERCVFVLASSEKQARKFARARVKREGHDWDLVGPVAPATSITFDGKNFSVTWSSKEAAAA